MAYELNGRDLVTIDQILARYIWNQDKAPSDIEKLDDKWIRDLNVLGDALIIDVNEYMKYGAGRFCSAADFSLFDSFFEKKDIKAGVYDFSSMYPILRPEKKDEIKTKGVPKQENFNTAIYQYNIACDSNDFITRAFVFGSTSFTADLDTIRFVVNEDGSKEIQGLKIYPSKAKGKEENFDFQGGTWFANLFNWTFEGTIDPQHLGRKVPIKFEGNVPAVTVTDKDFSQLKFEKSKLEIFSPDFQAEIKESIKDDNLFEDSTIGEQLLSKYNGRSWQYFKTLLKLTQMIRDSPSIKYFDNKGRKILYDSLMGRDNSGVLSAGDAFPVAGDEVWDEELLGKLSLPGTALIGGGGKDTLIGSELDDLLMGASSCQLEQDILMGREGYDTYIADKMDVIEDSDGDGEIFYVNGSTSIANKKILTGGFHYKNDPENTYFGEGNKYYWDGKDLIINDGLTVKNFNNGDLNIRLTEKDDTRPDIKDAEDIRSPIVIDMNGDGVKTSAKGKHVYFDHDVNGFAENTGWVDDNDALLVLDRNQNGQIEDGRELFGSNTLLASGEKAKNGFEALAEFDENHDGVIDAADSVWSKLQLWQDKNQNGVVDEGELSALSASQITAIGVNYENKKIKDVHGNEHRETTKVTWADGHQTDATDVWFDTESGDAFNTESIEIDKEIAKLPYVHGFGNVLDLHSAMQKDAVLKDMVKAYLAADAKTRDSMLNELIYRWTGSNQIDPGSRGKYIDDARKLVTLENLTGSDFLGTWCWGENDSNPHSKAAPILIREFNKFAEYVSASLLAEGVYKELFFPIILAQWNDEQQKIGYDYSKLNQELVKLVENNQLAEARELMQIDKNLGNYNSAARERRQANLLKVARDNGLIAQLYGEIDNIFISSNGNDSFNGNERQKDRYLFRSGHGQDVIDDRGSYNDPDDYNDLCFEGAKLADTQFVRSGNDLIIKAYGTNDSVTLLDFFNYSRNNIAFNFVFDNETITYNELISRYTFTQSGDDGNNEIVGWYGKDLLNGGAGDDILWGGDGDDILNGGEGHDILLGGNGRNILDGGEGNDTLWAGNDGDILDGGEGNDILNGGGGYDILIGGGGNDTLKGGGGKDRYEFEAGHGQDVVQDSGSDSKDDLNARNDLVFKGAKLADAEFIRSGTDLIIKAYGSTDSVTLQGYFSDSYYSRSFNFIFDDQCVTPYIDPIWGTGSDDILTGGDGDDLLNGLKGNDILNGGAGDDILNGGDGYDILNGGTGNDILNGGDGHKDRYEFETGHGQDVINDRAYDSRGYLYGSNDVVFKGAKLAEAEFMRSGNNLIVRAYKSADSVTLMDYFIDNNYKAFIFIFDDQSISYDNFIKDYTFTQNGDGKDNVIFGWQGNDILNGGMGNDILWGKDGNDILNGGAGDDILNGGDGYDILNGGAGNDILNGGDWHKDRYEFEAGHGQDVINDRGDDYLTEAYNDLVFKGASSADAKFLRYGDDLVIQAYGSADSVTLSNYFGRGNKPGIIESYYQSFNFIFDDQTIIHEDIRKHFTLIQIGDEKDNYLNGWADKNLINGGAGNDTLWGGRGDNILNGDDGNDELHAWGGNDILNGGAGDDSLWGGEGDDILNGGAGDDTLLGGEDDDILNGDEGNDALYGQSGNDILNGGAGDDILDGGEGDDILNGGVGDDVLNGGKGYDILNGGAGNDILNGGDWHKDRYEFEAGHGQDVVNDKGSKYSKYYDESFSKECNDLVFKGANLADAKFLRYGDDLVIQAYGSADSVTLPDYFSYLSYSRAFNFIFDDQTIVHEDIMKHYTFNQSGDEKDNVFQGWDGKDLLYGGAGNDTLFGGFGDDILDGGEGNDILHGDNGYDILIGGTGNDILKGGDYEKDRYEFEAGHGQDVINDQGTNYIYRKSQRNDVVFKGAKLADAKFTRSGNDLVIRAYGSADSVTLPDYFYYDDHASFNFLFDDQAITLEDIKKDYAFIRSGDEKDNIIFGWEGNDILIGGAGDDVLYGRSGNDILNGGVGNDILNGGDYEKDRYEFEAGHGQDVVNDLGDMGKKYLNQRNDLVFKGANLTDAEFIRSGNDLVIYAYGSADSVTLPDYFNTKNKNSRAFNFVFEDKSVTYENMKKNPSFGVAKAKNGNDIVNLRNIASNDLTDNSPITSELVSNNSNDPSAQIQNLLSAMAGFTPAIDDRLNSVEPIQQSMHLISSPAY